MIWKPLFAGLLAVFAAPAWAGDLAVTVTTPDGPPLPDAVVRLPALAGSSKPSVPWKLEVAQQNKQLAPFVLIAAGGTAITIIVDIAPPTRH